MAIRMLISSGSGGYRRYKGLYKLCSKRYCKYEQKQRKMVLLKQKIIVAMNNIIKFRYLYAMHTYLRLSSVLPYLLTSDVNMTAKTKTKTKQGKNKCVGCTFAAVSLAVVLSLPSLG